MESIRPERDADIDQVRVVHTAAFPTEAEARLVERLRRGGKAAVSLIAERDGQVVGHILFSPVTVGEPGGSQRGVGLAPVAVLPEHQRCGIGSRLIRAGLDACRRLGCPFVVVLGEPEYYRRFGFQPASEYRFDNEYGADEAFMVIELRAGGIPARGGLVKYSGEFAALDA